MFFLLFLVLRDIEEKVYNFRKTHQSLRNM